MARIRIMVHWWRPRTRISALCRRRTYFPFLEQARWTVDIKNNLYIRDLYRGGSRGRVQEMTCGFLIQLVFCQKKKTMWFIGVEVEQETSAPPPKKNPGFAPALDSRTRTTTSTRFALKFFRVLSKNRHHGILHCTFFTRTVIVTEGGWVLSRLQNAKTSILTFDNLFPPLRHYR